MADIWPRLKKKLPGDGKNKKKRSGKSNPFAASGLEKFATLLEGMQAAKGSSLVERTASSLSAARSISRSAQEWTATTLARSASRRSSESKLLQCAPAFEALAPKPVPAVVGNSENLSEERSHSHVGAEQVRCSSPLVGVLLPETTSRCRSMKKPRWRQTSKSAFIVLVAMGSFVSTRFGKAGEQLAAVLTFSAVFEVWRKGKASAWFTFSSIAVYFLTPLRSYLVTRIPTRLNSLPRNLKVSTSTNPTEKGKPNSETDTTTTKTEEEEHHNSSLGFPTLPLESASDDDLKESAPLSILLPIPETSSLSVTVVSKSSKASTLPRRLAKRVSSRFKKLTKKLRPSPSTSLSSSSVSDHHPEPNSPSSQPSSPDRRRMCPFSKRLHKPETITELAQNDDSTSSRKCAIIRRQRSSNDMLYKKSNRTLSSESLEEHMPSSTNILDDDNNHNINKNNDVSWPVVGLLVTLLFLLVGRFPAIMATSLFFVVVSNSQHDRAHSRGRARDTRALEAARRKLQRSPPRRI